MRAFSRMLYSVPMRTNAARAASAAHPGETSKRFHAATIAARYHTAFQAAVPKPFMATP